MERQGETRIVIFMKKKKLEELFYDSNENKPIYLLINNNYYFKQFYYYYYDGFHLSVWLTAHRCRFNTFYRYLLSVGVTLDPFRQDKKFRFVENMASVNQSHLTNHQNKN